MLATWAAPLVASVRFGVPGVYLALANRGVEPFSRYVKSITYAVSIALLVRSPPLLPTIPFVEHDLAISRGGKRRQ